MLRDSTFCFLRIIKNTVVTKISSCRVNQQVGGESNGQGFSSVLFFLYFPIKVAGENPRPPALNDNPVKNIEFGILMLAK